jgi:nitrogen-specific signal transduction histidine kinase
LDDKLPAWVIGDERRLRQVLINLISNAIKFTDVGDVHLAVVARNISHGEAVLRFTVEDTGIGIPADKQSEIFEEFRQVDNGLDRQHEGAGLGLSITRNILEAMNSSVSVISELGVGTSFQFELTLPIGSRPAENVASDHELLHGMRVMVVDDVNVNLLITQSMLESRGALVMGFHSAETALKSAYKVARRRRDNY